MSQTLETHTLAAVRKVWIVRNVETDAALAGLDQHRDSFHPATVRMALIHSQTGHPQVNYLRIGRFQTSKKGHLLHLFPVSFDAGKTGYAARTDAAERTHGRGFSDDRATPPASRAAATSGGASTPPVSQSRQFSPNNSQGCWVRSDPFPHIIAPTAQYLSHPQQIRCGCAGADGNFLGIRDNAKHQSSNETDYVA